MITGVQEQLFPYMNCCLELLHELFRRLLPVMSLECCIRFVHFFVILWGKHKLIGKNWSENRGSSLTLTLYLCYIPLALTITDNDHHLFKAVSHETNQ